MKCLQSEEIPILAIEVTAPVPPELPTSFTIRKSVESETELTEKIESSTFVSVKRMGGRTDQTEISIEGVRGKNMEIEVDDMSWETPDGSIDLFALPGKISHLSLIPQGMGEGGALIRVETEKSCRKKFLLTYGSENLAGGEANLCLKTGKAKLNLSTGALSSDGDFPFINNRGTFLYTRDDFPDRRKNNQFNRKFFDIFLAFSNLSFRYGTTSLLRGEPGLITFPGKYTHSYSLSEIFTLSMKNGNLLLYASEGRIREKYSDPSGEFSGFPEHIETFFNQREAGLKDSGQITRGIFWRYRMKAREVTLKNRYTGGHRRGEFFQYPAIIFSSDKLTLFFMTALNSVGHSFTFDPSAGFSLKEGSFDFSGNFSTHTNYPTMYELYFSHGLIQNNPHLEEGRGWYADFILKYSGFLNATLMTFRRQDENLIDYFLISGFRYKPLSLSSSSQQGLTIMINKKIDFLAFDLSATLNKTEYHRGNLSGDIPYIPEINSTGSVRVGTNPYFKLSLFFQKMVFLNLSNTKYIDHQWRMDGEIYYRFFTNFSIRFYRYNLFSTSFWSIRGFPTPLKEWEIDLYCRF